MNTCISVTGAINLQIQIRTVGVYAPLKAYSIDTEAFEELV